MKKLYYVRTNGYDMLVSKDECGNYRFLTETNEFPRTDEEIKSFTESVEDDSSWDIAENSDDMENELNESDVLYECEAEL